MGAGVRRGGGCGVGQGHHQLTLTTTSEQQTRTETWVNHSIPLERAGKGSPSLQPQKPPQKPPVCHHQPFSFHPHSSTGTVQSGWGAAQVPGGNSPGVP